MNFPIQLFALLFVVGLLFCGAEYGFSKEDAAIAASVSHQFARVP